MNDLNLFKKNGFLVKENLISQTKINKINKIVNEIISKEKKVMVQMELSPMITTILSTIQVLQKIKKF